MMKKLLIIVSILMMLSSVSVVAQTLPEVGDEIGNHGFRQVYFLDESGDKQFITDEMFTSADPMREGDYVTYMSQIRGSWQVFLYHIPTGTKVQLTVSGNNVNPEIEGGLVVWEGWVSSAGSGQVDGTWQIFLYDGTGVKQLTAGDTSVYPDIEGNYIIMARRDHNGSWRSVLYSVTEGTYAQVSINQIAKHPKLKGKKIFHGSEEFPLITDDIYLLGFDNIPGYELGIITEEDILQEIEGPDATSSAEVAAPELSEVTQTPEDTVNESTSETSQSEVGTDEADLKLSPSDQ